MVPAARSFTTGVPFAQLQVSGVGTDQFQIGGVHHLSYMVPVGEAVTAARRHAAGLGLSHAWKSDATTGNRRYASHVIVNGDLRLVMNGAYPHPEGDEGTSPLPIDVDKMNEWVASHGTGVKTIAVNVVDACEAYRIAVENGALGDREPRVLEDARGRLRVATILLYTKTDHLLASDAGFDRSGLGVKLMFVEGANLYDGFFPGYKPVEGPNVAGFGPTAIDHVVLNTTDMMATVRMLERVLGLHVFAKFSGEDVGTSRSGLNSVVMANNDHTLLLPINEPITIPGGIKSQIQEYLDANNGPGIQHVAMRTERLLQTLTHVEERRLFPRLPIGGANEEYYAKLAERVGRDKVRMITGGGVTERDYDQLLVNLRGLSILVGQDDTGTGVLFQTFLDTIGDAATLFYELIERRCIGGRFIPGCGGFGSDNFAALFAAIEEAQIKRGGA